MNIISDISSCIRECISKVAVTELDNCGLNPILTATLTVMAASQCLASIRFGQEPGYTWAMLVLTDNEGSDELVYNFETKGPYEDTLECFEGIIESNFPTYYVRIGVDINEHMPVMVGGEFAFKPEMSPEHMAYLIETIDGVPHYPIPLYQLIQFMRWNNTELQYSSDGVTLMRSEQCEELYHFPIIDVRDMFPPAITTNNGSQ